MVNIAFLVHKIPPQIDGIGDYTCNLANALSKYSHNINIITHYDENKSKSNSCTTKYDKKIKIFEKIRKWNLINFLSVIKIIKKSKSKILWLQYNPYSFNHYGICLFLVIWIFLLRCIFRIKIFITFHEFYTGWDSKHKILSRIHFLQFYLLGMLAQKIFITSERRMEIARNLFFWKRNCISYLPVGSNILPIECNSNSYNTFSDKPILTIFGLNPIAEHNKQLFYYLSQFKTHTKLDFKVWVIGGVEGKVVDEKKLKFNILKKLSLSDNIDYYGSLDSACISDLLNKSTIFLNYSGEGPCTKSSSLAAAFAHGIPVLSLKNPKFDSYFIDGFNIVLFENLTSFIDKLQLLIKQKDLREWIKTNSKKLYDEILSWDRISLICHLSILETCS